MIIVDSNIFIFGETSTAPEHDVAIRKYKEACQRDTIVTNVVILSEVFHFSAKISGAEGAAARIGNILNSPLVEFVGFTPGVVLKAAKLARDFRLRINDALIAQQAIDMNAAVLTDNVKDFKKIKLIRVLPLRTD